MKFYSTRNHALRVSLADAVIDGLAADGGLFLPESITPFSQEELKSITRGNFQQISLAVAERLLSGSLPKTTLEKVVHSAFSFDAKFVPLSDNLYVHELFHGPTLAFKDFGARFLAQLLGVFALEQNRQITVLVATSGDTGGAVAAGFHKTPGVRVALLYPKGRVSPLQEQQLTTFADNIHAFQVEGSFDDCQALVKKAFTDAELKKQLFLTSANSINIARLLPQSFYYFSAYAALNQPDSLSFSVPSGNFGNITAGIIAQRLGLPIAQLVAGTNANDTIPRYLSSGNYQPLKSVLTISNAMDVGDPSNIERLNVLHNNSIDQLRSTISAIRFSDQETVELMKELHTSYNYLAEPHTAIAYGALKKLCKQNDSIPKIFLSTAHPIKFSEVIKDALNIDVPLPENLKKLMELPRSYQTLKPDYQNFKSALLSLPV